MSTKATLTVKTGNAYLLTYQIDDKSGYKYLEKDQFEKFWRYSPQKFAGAFSKTGTSVDLYEQGSSTELGKIIRGALNGQRYPE